ncbi:glyoxylase-like metal-dependent hydrolase (beta-lactamase superfamily II) [Acetoanaerobium pronyense]|uniref:Glyoxylase-like metal-dependent hydrolase (Beta-lactamase superfamily II) n=1 Tax=Acetoanaerobium pronyense TaxID=1482736 RepID=A0ABS4KL72_9FIRM|nr:MBL fold metallo-hydrolase [Acetoanaerobium pronyense]MBP2028526.1 glyoxylase-like metal-dependent hydrolase (beta-lactamase superfamily II) [Acetoanaerobium pronyense]
MKIEKLVIGMHESNCYIVSDESKALIIDPGGEAGRIVKQIRRNNLEVVGIVLTHYHCDHIEGVEEVKKAFDCKIFAHKKEVKGLLDPNINHTATLSRKPLSITADELLSEGSKITISEHSFLEVVHTPGHTPGGICLISKENKVAFTGDTLFEDGLGRTDLEGGNEDLMKKSVSNKISNWEDEIAIYPGHGHSVTMKDLRKRNINYLK